MLRTDHLRSGFCQAGARNPWLPWHAAVEVGFSGDDDVFFQENRETYNFSAGDEIDEITT